MMNKKILILILIIVLNMLLSGCRLARPDDMQTEENKLVGIFVTTKPLDLFDIEKYYNDNINSINSGSVNNIIETPNDSSYYGKLYSEVKKQILTDEETGKKTEYWEYVFTSVEGIPFFYAEITPPDGNSYITNSSGSIVSEAHISIGDKTNLNGTIYVVPGKFEAVYINPVYQERNGRVYVTTGEGYYFSDYGTEGLAVTSKLEETKTITENGKEKKESFEVEIKIEFKYPPKKINIIQMKNDNTILSAKTYKPETLPENIKKENETAYIIVETNSESSFGDLISREILEPGDSSFTSYFAREDGFCEGKYVGLIWE